MLKSQTRNANSWSVFISGYVSGVRVTSFDGTNLSMDARKSMQTVLHRFGGWNKTPAGLTWRVC